jgi:hypothetical protein
VRVFPHCALFGSTSTLEKQHKLAQATVTDMDHQAMALGHLRWTGRRKAVHLLASWCASHTRRLTKLVSIVSAWLCMKNH